MEKVLSVCLALVMMFCIIPLGANAAVIEEERGTAGMTDSKDYIVGKHTLKIEEGRRIISGKTGDCTWTLVDKVLTISGKGAMADYDRSTIFNYPELSKELYLGNCVPWFWHTDEIKAVIIEEGVTHIGAYAFMDFSKITSITIPDSVVSIGCLAFQNCSSLKYANIPYGIERLENSEFNVSMMQSIVLPDTVIYIEAEALGDFNRLTDVYYMGSEEDKSKIVVDKKYYLRDKFLNRVTWHYNTCRVHTYINSCDTTCEKCDITREIKHTYDDKYDGECNVCKDTMEVPQKDKKPEKKDENSSKSSKKTDTVDENMQNDMKKGTSHSASVQNSSLSETISNIQESDENTFDTTTQSIAEKKENSQLPIGTIIVTTVVTAAILCGGATVFYFIKRRKHG